MIKHKWITPLFYFFLLTNIPKVEAKPEEKEEERVLRQLSQVLEELPEQLTTLPQTTKNVAFYYLKMEQNGVLVKLNSAIQGMIIASFAKASNISLVSLPELKPTKVTLREDKLLITPGISTSEEMQYLKRSLGVDGLIEGEVFASPALLYLNLRIIDPTTGGIIWAHDFSTKVFPKLDRAYATDIDMGVGLTWFNATDLDTTPLKGEEKFISHLPYYTFEFRIIEPAWPIRQFDFGARVGFLHLVNGIAFKDAIYIKPFLRGGIIRKSSTTDRAYWLAATLQTGWIIPFGDNVNLAWNLGLGLEMDLTKHLSVSFGLSYMDPLEGIFEKRRVKIAGTPLELFGIRFYLTR